ncbi:hypothetical protein GRX03_05275 [Halovenus sp. WSH3]|uniref:Uncharacterized protein n=1 Tax=Halovenus carboxidivorans TaxID=2692199 RepID=A0A6B0T1H6_9EURY|nr:hypothetical protein [Halovenus carboxidivorans]MXR51017.1 hypothetical protein [Halovenus carboxidivorans]
MMDVDLPDEIRGHVENELDHLIRHIDHFREEWLAQADINPSDDEAVVAFALGAVMIEMEHYLEDEFDDEDSDEYLQEAAKIVKSGVRRFSARFARSR